MEIEVSPYLNYSLVAAGYQHTIPFVSLPPGTNAVAYLEGGFSDRLYLRSGTSCHVGPHLNAALIAQLSAPITIQLIVETDGGEHRETPVVMLPLCAWDQRSDYAAVTAAFVLDHDPIIQRLLRQASVLPSPDQGALDTPALLERVYAALRDSFKTCYLFERSLLWKYDHTQLIRFPSQMHFESAGTCIDLVLLFAGMLRAAGAAPVIIMTGKDDGARHALLGAWLTSYASSLSVLDPDTLHGAIKFEQLILLDVTAMTQNAAFGEAVAHGASQAQTTPLLWGVDVNAARRQVQPLPEQPCTVILGGLPARITDDFTITRTSQASNFLSQFAVEILSPVLRPDGAGEGHGVSIPLRGYAVRLGRSRLNTIIFEDATVSRFHANVFVHQGQLYIKDLGSKCGTQVQEAYIEPYQPHPLQDGQLFQLGDVACRLTRMTSASYA